MNTLTEFFLKYIFFTLLTIIPFYSFSQDDDSKFYQHFEPRFNIGVTQELNSDNINTIEIYHPSYEFGLSYSFNLPNNFLLLPFIGFSSISINTTPVNNNNDNGIAFETFNSLILGSSLYYKLNKWGFGASIFGKNIFNVQDHFSYISVLNGISHQNFIEYDASNEFNKIYYLCALNIRYSFSHIDLMAEARYSPLGIQPINPFNGNNFGNPIHINEYLIGIGYHL